MALRNIRIDGDEILRKISKPVSEINDSIIALLDDMAETMKGRGVGLAAPQVGILKRVIIVDIGEGVIELINPEIISCEGEQTRAEGCLSIPEVFGEVTRPYKVRVEGLNRHGEKVVIDAEDFLTTVLCHEIDHLNGILFKDKAVRFIDIEGKRKK